MSRYDARERATKSTPFRFVATKETKREREIHATERLRTRLSFSSDFASPPKSFSPIEIRTRERKKERKNDEVYSSLLLSSIINSSSLYIVLMNYVKSVVSASVSLGQFYRYLVRIHHGTPRRRERRVQIPFHDDEEEVKEKREERSKTSASLNALKKGAHINVPSVSAARTNKSSFVVFEGEKGSALMVRRWFKTRSRS